jgi:hypothetical protein
MNSQAILKELLAAIHMKAEVSLPLLKHKPPEQNPIAEPGRFVLILE